MNDQKKYLPAALAVIAIIIALVAAYRLHLAAAPAVPPPPAEEAAVPVAKVDKPAGIVRAGRVERPLALVVTSGYGGRIDELYVSEGQSVKAGQPLYKLAGTPPAPNNATNVAAARQEYEKLRSLYEKGAIARRRVEAAAARLQAAEQSAPPGGAGGAPATVAAPVDGIVADLSVAAGSAVQAGQKVLAIGGGQKIAVTVPLQPNELNVVPLGGEVAVEAAGRTVKGRISAIYPEARADKVPEFTAHIKLLDPPDGLQEGIPVTIRIDIAP